MPVSLSSVQPLVPQTLEQTIVSLNDAQKQAVEHIDEVQNEIDRLNEQAVIKKMKVNKKKQTPLTISFSEGVRIDDTHPIFFSDNICQPSTSICII